MLPSSGEKCEFVTSEKFKISKSARKKRECKSASLANKSHESKVLVESIQRWGSEVVYELKQIPLCVLFSCSFFFFDEKQSPTQPLFGLSPNTSSGEFLSIAWQPNNGHVEDYHNDEKEAK